jgi:hypothetical protein
MCEACAAFARQRNAWNITHAALMREDEPALAEVVGERAQARRERAEVAAPQQHAAQRVEEGRVKAAAHEDDVGAEGAQRRLDDAVEGALVGADAAARRQRNVEVEASARASANGVDAAGFEGVKTVLMQRHDEHVGALEKGRLGAIAVMDVDVHDGHAAREAALDE